MEFRITLLLLAVVCNVASDKVSHSAGNENEEVMMQVSVPSLFDSHGRTVVSIAEKEQSERTRRSIDEDSDEFDLDLGSNDLHFKVTPLKDVLVERRKLNYSESYFTNGCFYGGLKTMDSWVYGVFNLCRGVEGVVYMPGEEVYIEPVGGGGSAIHRDHVITRKIVHKGHGEMQGSQGPSYQCGVDLDTTGAKIERGNRMNISQDYPHSNSSRQKRDLYGTGPKYVELLIATDDSVVKFHGRNLVEQYLLTMSHLVNSIYQHPSLGVDIEIVTVKLLIIEEDEADKLVVEGDAKGTLDAFCQWVYYQGVGKYPYESTFDMAIYITQRDIGPAGYAPVTGMCNPIRSCTVNKDEGISSAFVIAHEMGHVFGMQHDGFYNDCEKDPEDGKLMASMVQASYDKYYWTECSSQTLKGYIGGMYCLNNKPRNAMETKFSKPFGQSWTLDEQCRQEFGEDFKLCRAFGAEQACENLWCSKSDTPLLCKTKRGPPLPGTMCGAHKWCMEGKCQRKAGAPVDGQWGAWGGWAQCSRTCGKGVHYRTRRCNDPLPSRGGKPCEGRTEDVELCNPQPCPSDGIEYDFRADQCSWLNKKKYHNGGYHTWLPIENQNVSQLCKLTCMSRQTGDVIVSEDNVVDGTFCSYELENDICVKGKCLPVGCDNVLFSEAKMDTCGVCAGDGRSCRNVAGNYTAYLKKKRYHRLIRLPAQARNLVISQNKTSPHFLAVKDESNGQYLLNARGHQGSSRQFVHQGSRFIYLNRRRGDSLASKGPLQNDLLVLAYSATKRIPFEVFFQYDIPNNRIYELPAESIYGFPGNNRHVDEDVGIVQNGKDVDPEDPLEEHEVNKIPQVTEAPRRRPEQNEIQEEIPRQPKPEIDRRPPINRRPDINRRPQRRPQRPKPAPDRAKEKDPNLENTIMEEFIWRVSEWTACSKTCGEGVQFQVYKCMDMQRFDYVDGSRCPASKPQVQSRDCNPGPCLRWELGEWGNCTEECGRHGLQERTLYCVTDYYGDNMPVDTAYCNQSNKPASIRPCNREPCVSGYVTTAWSKCSVTCGIGEQYRQVYCDRPNPEEDYLCIGDEPENTRPCDRGQCYERSGGDDQDHPQTSSSSSNQHEEDNETIPGRRHQITTSTTAATTTQKTTQTSTPQPTTTAMPSTTPTARPMPTVPHRRVRPRRPRPGTSRPGASRPGIPRPGVSRPGVSRPGVSRPGATRPGVPRPGAKPGASRPGGRRYPGRQRGYWRRRHRTPPPHAPRRYNPTPSYPQQRKPFRGQYPPTPPPPSTTTLPTTTQPTTTPTTTIPTTTTRPTTTATQTTTTRPTTTTTRPTTKKWEQVSCLRDKSFFCKFASSRNCHVNLYKTMCCFTCHIIRNG